MINVPPCPVCGEEFEDVFDATDHLLEDDEQEFDPKLILPNGYTLMVGSLLRCLYGYANDPEQIKAITQSTYATLYAAENNPEEIKTLVENMVIAEHMHNIDDELKELLSDEQDGE